MKKATVEKPEEDKVVIRSKGRLFFLWTTGFVLVVGLVFTTFAFFTLHRITPHATIAGVDVGGLTRELADQKLKAKEADFSHSNLILSQSIHDWKFSASDLGMNFNNQKALDQAYSYGKTGSFGQQVKEIIASLFTHRYYETDLQPLSSLAKNKLHKTIAEVESQAVETNLAISADKVEVIEGKPGNKLDEVQFETDLYSTFKAGGTKIGLNLISSVPRVSAAQAQPALLQAQQIVKSDWQLQVGTRTFPVTRADIVSWISVVDNADVTGLNIQLNEDKIKQAVQNIASQVDVQPTNAVLKGNSDGTITVAKDSVPGVKVDTDQTVKAIERTLLSNDLPDNRTIVSVGTVAQAALTRDNYSQIGIKELIGTATTDFVGSPTNRVFNITLGESKINGSVVQPGQEFSTVGTLAPIDEAHGYKPELVILNNKLEYQAGGGLCQVSTTLFRAVLNAGLPVTERQSHSFEVSYYQIGYGPGYDATVYDPKPDFKFKNDMSTPIYVQSYIVGTKITFELYGTKDGRVSTVDRPVILQVIPHGDTIYTDSDTMYKGDTKIIEHAADGGRTSLTYNVVKDGKTTTQTFLSYYVAVPEQILRGTKDRPN